MHTHTPSARIATTQTHTQGKKLLTRTERKQSYKKKLLWANFERIPNSLEENKKSGSIICRSETLLNHYGKRDWIWTALTWSFLCFKGLAVMLRVHAALSPCYLMVSMRHVGISHHLARLISVSRINPARVILLMLLLSSFSLPPANCMLFKFYAFKRKEY